MECKIYRNGEVYKPFYGRLHPIKCQKEYRFTQFNYCRRNYNILYHRQI